MNIDDLLGVADVHILANIASKKQLLCKLAELAAQKTGLESAAILTALNEREKLGSTGMGSGIAIPHASLEGLEKITGLFCRLEKPVEFDAADGENIDLVFLLLAPPDGGAEHLKALSRLARLFRQKQMVRQIREIANTEIIYQLISQTRADDAA